MLVCFENDWPVCKGTMALSDFHNQFKEGEDEAETKGYFEADVSVSVH